MLSGEFQQFSVGHLITQLIWCFQQLLCYLQQQPQRFNKLLSFSVIFNFVFDQCAGLVALFSLCALSDSCACILSVRRVCVVNGHCLAVIHLCSSYLDCQVVSTRANNLPRLSRPFASPKQQREKQKPRVNILPKFSSLQKIQ